MTATTPQEAAPFPDADVSIWRESAFVRLWTAASISFFGSSITRTALPFTAILVLGAGPFEVASLRSVEFLGLLLFGLFAGAWVDRIRKRPIMIATDLGRAVLVGSIPVAAVTGHLTLAHLVVVAFLAAALSTFFNAASAAYLPTVVARTRLIAANSALLGSESATDFAGQSFSGFLVQLVTAPITLVVDAVSFVGSAVLLATIRRPEARRAPIEGHESVLGEIRAGIRVVASSPVLRACAASHAAMFVFWGVFFATYLLFAIREVGLAPAAVGVIVALGGIGSLIGAGLAGSIARRLGVGRAMMLGLTGMTIGGALLPLAPSGAVFVAGALLVCQQLLSDGAVTVYDVVERSLTQSVVEPRLLGRVNATIETLTTLVAFLASIVGGVVAELFGLRAALALGVLGGVVAIAFVWFSPIRGMRDMPEPALGTA